MSRVEKGRNWKGGAREILWPYSPYVATFKSRRRRRVGVWRWWMIHGISAGPAFAFEVGHSRCKPLSLLRLFLRPFAPSLFYPGLSRNTIEKEINTGGISQFPRASPSTFDEKFGLPRGIDRVWVCDHEKFLSKRVPSISSIIFQSAHTFPSLSRLLINLGRVKEIKPRITCIICLLFCSTDRSAAESSEKMLRDCGKTWETRRKSWKKFSSYSRKVEHIKKKICRGWNKKKLSVGGWTDPKVLKIYLWSMKGSNRGSSRREDAQFHIVVLSNTREAIFLLSVRFLFSFSFFSLLSRYLRSSSRGKKRWRKKLIHCTMPLETGFKNIYPQSPRGLRHTLQSFRIWKDSHAGILHSPIFVCQCFSARSQVTGKISIQTKKK